MQAIRVVYCRRGCQDRAVAEKDDDPAGDDFPDTTMAEAMLEAIQSLKGSDEL